MVDIFDFSAEYRLGAFLSVRLILEEFYKGIKITIQYLVRLLRMELFYFEITPLKSENNNLGFHNNIIPHSFTLFFFTVSFHSFTLLQSRRP